MKSFLNQLDKPFLVLAPMEDVTDAVFRQVIASCTPPDLFFTEFVNVDGLQSVGRTNLFKRLRAGHNEQPLIAQFWGKNPDNYSLTAQQIVDGSLRRELGNEIDFAGFDINMGCPDKAIIKNGCCGAFIENRSLAEEVIDATRDGLNGKLTLSVKTRVGLKMIDLSWIEFLLQQNLDMLSVHVRTVKEQSLVPAHHDLFADIVKLRDRLAPRTLLVGNGDVLDRAHAEKLASQYGLDGVMVGRGIFQDPYLFAEDSPWQSMEPIQKMDLYARHVKQFAGTWQNNERKVHTLNKFCKVYISGFDGAKEMREKLMKATSTDELLKLLHNARISERTLLPSVT